MARGDDRRRRERRGTAQRPTRRAPGPGDGRPRVPRSLRVLRSWTIAIGVVCAACIAVLIWLAIAVAGLSGQVHELQRQANSLTSDLAALQATVGKDASDEQAAQKASNGDVAPPEPVKSPHTESGTYTTGDAELDRLVKDFCDAHEDVYDAYLGIAWAEYVENDRNQDPQGSRWWVDYAKQQLRDNAGNCYNFAAAIQEVLRYFGYEDATAFPAIVKFQSGDWGPHGLVTVTVDGARKVIDAAQGSNGWLLDGDSIIYQLDDSKAQD